jgi:hypothetical protein
MKRVQLGLFIFLWFPVLSLAQTPPASPDQRMTATVTVNAPIYVSAPPRPGLGPLRTAAIGTLLTVLGEQDGWWQVQFNDPQYGLRVGWVQKQFVRVEDPSLRPMDLSVAAPITQATPPTREAVSQNAAAAPQQAAASGRGGFTVLVNLGLGIQQIEQGDSQVGLGGANFGILTPAGTTAASLGAVCNCTVKGQTTADGRFLVDRSQLVGKPIHRVDMRIQKRINLGGRRNLEGMVEVFNILNHQNYGSYTTTFSNAANYGKPAFNSATAYLPRILQLGVHFTF